MVHNDRSVREQWLCCRRATVMVSETNGYGVREQRLLCQRATAMVSKSIGYGVREQSLWCQRATLMVSESNGYDIIVSEINGNGVRSSGYSVKSRLSGLSPEGHMDT
jgi:hypothetical protein